MSSCILNKGTVKLGAVWGESLMHGSESEGRSVTTFSTPNSITDAGDTIHDFGTGDKIDLGAVLDNIGYLGSSPISDQYVRYFLTPFVETKHDKSLQIWTEANQSDQHNLSGYNDVISS